MSDAFHRELGASASEPRSIPTSDEIDSILDTLGKLKPGNAVRDIAIQIIRGEPLDSVQALTGVLQSSPGTNWAERTVAAWCLGHLRLPIGEYDAAAIALFDVLAGTPTMPIWRRALLRSLGISGAIGLLITLWIIMAEVGPLIPLPLVFLTASTVLSAWTLPIVGSFSLHSDLRRVAELRSAAAISLGQMAPPEALGVLAQSLFDRNFRVSAASAAALHQLLPQISEAHYGLYGADAMQHLGRALSHSDTQLVMKVLEALEKTGGASAIPYVEKTVAQGRTRLLRQTATRVVGVLKERQRQETESSRLLRATHSPLGADALLRPAASGQGEPERLLRTVGGEEV